MLMNREQIKEVLPHREPFLLVDEVEEGGSIDEEEGDLLRNAIDFTEQEAEDILTHRVDLEAVPLEATKAQIAEHFAESRFSRILVYKDCWRHSSERFLCGTWHYREKY